MVELNVIKSELDGKLDIIEKFKGKTMAVVGYETDQV